MSNCKTNTTDLSSVERDPVFLSQKGKPGGVATLDAAGQVLISQIPIEAMFTERDPIYIADRGIPFGCATLDGLAHVPRNQLGSGAADATTFLRGDGSWAFVQPSAGLVTEAQLADEAATRAAADLAIQLVLQSNINDVVADLASEEAARIAEDLTFLKVDGSRTMEADLNLDTFKVVNLGNGTVASDAVNKGQVDATVAAAIAEGIQAGITVAGYNYYRQHAQYSVNDVPTRWSLYAGSILTDFGTPLTVDDTGGRWKKYTTGAVSGNSAGYNAGGGPGWMPANRNPVYRARMKTGPSVSSCQIFFGFSYGDPLLGLTGTAGQGYYTYGVVLDGTNPNWQLMLQANTVASLTDSGIPAVADTEYLFSVDLSTYTADGRVKLWIDGVKVVDVVAGSFVVGAQSIDPYVHVKTQAASAKSVYHGPAHLDCDGLGDIDTAGIFGDFKANGSVPMTGDLDFGGNKGTNAADGMAATDVATIGQVDALVDAGIVAADIPGQVAAAVSGTRLLQAAIAGAVGIFNTVAAHNVFQDIPSAFVSFTLAYPQRVTIHADGFGVDNGSNSVLGQMRFRVIDSASATHYPSDGPAVYGGNDVNFAPIGLTRISVVLPAGLTLVNLQYRNPLSNAGCRVQVTDLHAEYMS